MAVTFNFDFDRGVTAILYLASRPAEVVTALDKYKVCKLLFLADKYHLVQYGRPILGDFYKALPWGPVPQITLNGIQVVLDEKPKGSFAQQLAERLKGQLVIDRAFANPRFGAEEPDLSYLSRSDLEALDHVIAEHGRKSFEELMALTHRMAPYRKAWESRRRKKAVIMRYEDFFEEDANAVPGAKELMVDNFTTRKGLGRSPEV